MNTPDSSFFGIKVDRLQLKAFMLWCLQNGFENKTQAVRQFIYDRTKIDTTPKEYLFAVIKKEDNEK